MLSKPLAPPSVFGSVNKRVWGPIVSAPRQKKNTPSDCWCRQIERLWFFSFLFSVKWDLSTIIHSFPVRGAEPALGAFGNRYWFELWLLLPLCQNTQEPRWTRNAEQHLVCELNWGRHARGKNAPICQHIHIMSASALYHRHVHVSSLTWIKSVFWVLRCMCMRRGKPCKMMGLNAWVRGSLHACMCVYVCCIRHVFTQGCDGKALAWALAFSQ